LVACDTQVKYNYRDKNHQFKCHVDGHSERNRHDPFRTKLQKHMNWITIMIRSVKESLLSVQKPSWLRH